MKVKDRIIIGAGLNGLYSTLYCMRRNSAEKILILEYDQSPFSRATYINQARIHMGYHFPGQMLTNSKGSLKIQAYAVRQ